MGVRKSVKRCADGPDRADERQAAVSRIAETSLSVPRDISISAAALGITNTELIRERLHIQAGIANGSVSINVQVNGDAADTRHKRQRRGVRGKPTRSGAHSKPELKALRWLHFVSIWSFVGRFAAEHLRPAVNAMRHLI